MDSINFIKTPKSKKQQQVYRWYRISALALVSVIAILASINAYQYYQLKTTQAPAKQLLHVNTHIDTLSERIKKLTAEQEQLAVRHKKLAKQSTARFAPANYLQEVAALIPDDTCLATADLSKKRNIQLSGYTASAHSLHKFVQGLEQSPQFTNVHLSSLQPDTAADQTLYRFALTAQLQSA